MPIVETAPIKTHGALPAPRGVICVWGGRDSNPQGAPAPVDFKSTASACSATAPYTLDFTPSRPCVKRLRGG